MLLEIDVGPIEMVLQRVYKYISEVKNMPNHRFPHLVWNVGCKIQKNHKTKILSSSSVDLKKWFKRLGVESLFEVLGDARKYIVIEERLTELPRKS